MNLQKSENSASAPVFHLNADPEARPGGRWTDRQLSFGLQARDALHLTYVFYEWEAEAYPGFMGEPWLHIRLDHQSFCFGNWWGWKIQFDPGCNLPNRLAYAILLEKKDDQSNWVLDPFSRVCAGGEYWNRPVCFQIEPDSYKLQQINRSPGSHFQGLRRLAAIKPQEPVLRPNRPELNLSQCIIYECHVRGMTRLAHEGMDRQAAKGTFKALSETIPHLKKLGINVVELLPVFEFDENENPLRHPDSGNRLLNYWGYSPILFQVPKQSYAKDFNNPEIEFRRMVDAFHQAGIEVWLDVVFNHTAELNDSGPAEHFKLLGREDWYLLSKDGEFLNFSGCGNTFKCAAPGARRMIRDSLVYWAQNLGVDGFRFDLASILERDPNGNFHQGSELLWELKNDSELAGIKMIAEPWDAVGGYRLGYPSKNANWAEWNDSFRDTVRKAVRGEEGQMTALKEAILGSPGKFGSTEKGREFSINFITSHDGMTLNDLVSYNIKYNLENGEENRDGHHSEFSFNCGIEGPTQDAEVLELRRRKIRLMHFLLQVSNGIPMILAGDEMLRTQLGNNNAYCHDSPLTWVDWTLAERNLELVEYVGSLIDFRKKNFGFLFSETSHYRWFNAIGVQESLEEYVRTLHWQVLNQQSPETEFRFLVNCFERPVEFQVPENNEWEVKLDSYGDVLGPISWEKPGSVWVEGFSAKCLKFRGDGKLVY